MYRRIFCTYRFVTRSHSCGEGRFPSQEIKKHCEHRNGSAATAISFSAWLDFSSVGGLGPRKLSNGTRSFQNFRCSHFLGQPQKVVPNFRKCFPETDVFHLICNQNFRIFCRMESAPKLCKAVDDGKSTF